jgi:hypothetical protein
LLEKGEYGPVEELVKKVFFPGLVFEELGLRYIGPVQGHSLSSLIEVFQDARKQQEGPVLIHCVTRKGRGYMPAQEDPELKVQAETEALKLYRDAQALLDRIIAERRFQARGLFGFFPANSVGDDIEVYTDETRREVRRVLHTLRQQVIKKDKPNFALSDYIAPKASGRADYVGGFCAGIHGADELAKEYEAAHDPYHGILAKAVADRLAEAFAEYLHQQARFAWGYEKPGDLTMAETVKEKYRGIRPAPGYPAQPDHTEKPILFDLLDATARTGVANFAATTLSTCFGPINAGVFSKNCASIGGYKASNSKVWQRCGCQLIEYL